MSTASRMSQDQNLSVPVARDCAEGAACLNKAACCSLLPGCDRWSGLRAPGSWGPFGDKGLLDLAVKAEERWVGDKRLGSA